MKRWSNASTPRTTSLWKTSRGYPGPRISLWSWKSSRLNFWTTVPLPKTVAWGRSSKKSSRETSRNTHQRWICRLSMRRWHRNGRLIRSTSMRPIEIWSIISMENTIRKRMIWLNHLILRRSLRKRVSSSLRLPYIPSIPPKYQIWDWVYNDLCRLE